MPASRGALLSCTLLTPLPRTAGAMRGFGHCRAFAQFYLGRYHKQAELLKALTDEDMRVAHDAECDAEACAKCYVALLQA